jgi:hypothetical protein
MDPFDGLIVWGTLGFLGWFVVAATLGAGLRWLHALSRRQQAAAPPQASHASRRVGVGRRTPVPATRQTARTVAS